MQRNFKFAPIRRDKAFDEYEIDEEKDEIKEDKDATS